MSRRTPRAPGKNPGAGSVDVRGRDVTFQADPAMRAATPAGALFVVSDVLNLADAPETADALLAGLLLLIGLYARRSEGLDLLGLFGFVTAFSSTVMALGGSGRTPPWRPPYPRPCRRRHRAL